MGGDEGSRPRMEFPSRHNGGPIPAALSDTVDRHLASEESSHLLILDLRQPGLDGLSSLRASRRDGESARLLILVPTCNGDKVQEVVEVDLSAGGAVAPSGDPADYYDLVDPLSRVKDLFRRVTLSEPTHVLRAGAIEVDLDSRRVSVDGNAVKLTQKEFQVLKVLIEAHGRALRRADVLERVWRDDAKDGVGPRRVDVYVHRLRGKLRGAGGGIRTVRSVGYCLAQAC